MSIHKPVFLKEAIEALNLKEGDIAVDATLGAGGHSLEILKKIGKDGKLVAIDQDKKAIENFKEKFLEAKVIDLTNGNFSNLGNILEKLEIKKVNAILADIGISSDQLEDESYGMSFQKEAELDMRMNCESEMTAQKIVNGYSQEKLEEIIKKFGEERFARNIARKIFEIRKNNPIRTTKELAEIIISAIPERFRHSKIHPATRTFQALRIETNRELENLEKFIPVAIAALERGGRLAIISFHSLEDRIVKNIFRENARGCICPKNFPECRCGKQPIVKIITKKPIVPSLEEIGINPRSRSAKMRVCEKL